MKFTPLLSVVALGLAEIIAPMPPVAPSKWAAEHVVLPDGEHASQKIDLSRTPHIVEPLDLLGPDSPVNEIGVMKSAQSGFTTMLLCSAAHSIVHDPCDMMIVQPTDGALAELFGCKRNGFESAQRAARAINVIYAPTPKP